MSRLLSRRRAVAALVLALVALLVGVSLNFILPRSATITLTAAPGGHITPSGPTTAAVGSQLQITAYDDDPTWQAGLMVGAQIVAPTSVGNGRYVYTLTVAGDTTVQASFAQLAPSVRLMDPAAGAAIASVSADQTEVIFAHSTPVVDQLAVGDILANGAGSGYPHSLIVRVAAVADVGSQVVLTTAPVPLTDAVLQASVQLRLPLPLTVPPSAGPTGSPTALAPFGPPVAKADDKALDGLQLSLDHTWTGSGGDASGSASVHGELSVAAPSLNVDLHISPHLFPPGGTVDLFEVSVSEQASASLTLDAQAKYAMQQKAVLVDHDLGMIWMWIGCLVEVSPHLDAGVGIDLSASGHLHADGGITANLESGVRYQNSTWSPIQVAQITPHGSVTLDATATARVYPFLNLSANIYGLCGPYVDIQPGFLELAADVNANPWWTLDAGIHLGVGAKCAFTDAYELAGADVRRETVASAGGPMVAIIPPTTTPSHLPPESTATPIAASSAADPTMTDTPMSSDKPLAVAIDNPSALAFDAAGNLYVGDWKRVGISTVGTIHKIAPDGSASNIDVPATAPMGLAFDAAGNLYVAAGPVLKLTPDGNYVAWGWPDDAGTASVSLGALAFDSAGNLFAADTINNKIYKVSTSEVVSIFAGPDVLSSPTALAFDAAGNLYVADFGGHLIRKISPAGVVSTFAGSGAPGSTDGTASEASFSAVNALAFDAAGNLYVADDNLIRKINPAGVVSTFAGSGVWGSTDGFGPDSSFSAPCALAFDAAGDLYVADLGDTLNTPQQLGTIRKISPTGWVSTFAVSAESTETTQP